METIKDIFVSGPGPSSSHTIGPYKAALDFKNRLKGSENIKVTLYGSLALTGKGHGTDLIILRTLSNFKTEVIFNFGVKKLSHPNTILFEAFENNKLVHKQKYYSVGGGKIVTKLRKQNLSEVYPFKNFEEIKKYSYENNCSLVDIVNKFEDNSLDDYLNNALDIMFKNIEKNLLVDGLLPGKLKVERVAKKIYNHAINFKDKAEQYSMLLTSFAYASLEGNAVGDIVVTAPTCGSCGIVPAILYHEYKFNNVSKFELINALKVAGLIGNVCKENASLSGAVLGCQAEVGVASSMASAALCYIRKLDLYQIEYASEVALEHFLGLTCDPVGGYVIIPCIERNGIAALRAYISYLYAKNIGPYRKNKVSFDEVVKAMKDTGKNLNSDYKETAIGGLAKILK